MAVITDYLLFMRHLDWFNPVNKCCKWMDSFYFLLAQKFNSNGGGSGELTPVAAFIVDAYPTEPLVHWGLMGDVGG